MSTAAVESLEQRLAGRLAGHVQAPDLPSAAQVVSWMDLVDLCRELDDALVRTEAPSIDALALHEAVINLAIGCGGWLIHQIRTNGLIFPPRDKHWKLWTIRSNCCEFFIAPGTPNCQQKKLRRFVGASSMPRPEYIARLHGAYYDLRTCEASDRPRMLTR